MHSSSFRFFSVVVSTALLAALILVIGLAIRDNPASALPQLSTVAPSVTLPVTSTAADVVIDAVIPTSAQSQGSLGGTFRLPGGGFTLRAPAGYVLDIDDQSALLRAEEGPSAGMILRLEGGTREHFAAAADETTDALFRRLAEVYAAEHDLEVGDPESVAAGTTDGLAAPLTGEAQAGQFVLVQPDADQLFTLAAAGPQAVWGTQGAADVRAVLDTLDFFAPLAPTTEIADRDSATPSATAPATPNRLTAQATSSSSTSEQATVLVPDATTPTPHSTAEADETPQPGHPPAVQVYSNGNFVNSVAAMRSTVWAATGGGVVAWNKSSGGYVKFTVMDGLSANRTRAATICPLPGLGVLFAGDVGIQVFDTQNGSWRTLDSNSGMSYDNVSTLWCDAERGVLVVGYTNAGLDLFDANANTWTYIGEGAGLAISGVRDLAVAGNLAPIWLATDEGLVAYEAGEVTIYTTENSPLVDNRIETLAVDGSGAVWLATGNTLYRTNGEEWSAFNAEGAGQADFPNGRITGLDVGSDGAIWIGSDQAQICRFDPGIEGCIVFYSGEDGMATAPLTSLTIGPDGEVYYTTAGGGISAYNGSEWRQMVIENERVPGNTIQDLAQDEAGAVWVGALGGASHILPGEDADAEIFTTANSALPSVDVRVVQPGSEGGMWFGTEGISFYDGATWISYTTADGLAGSPIQAITTDDQGRTWIGTQTGLSIWTGSTFFNLTGENGLPSDDISALLADGNVIWIGTRGGGLLRFQDNQLQVFNRSNIALPSNSITALTLDADGALLIGTDQGLARFMNAELTPVEPLQSAPILALAGGPDGALWAVDGESLLYRSEGATWTPFALTLLPGPQISSLLVDDAGDVWLGYTQGGLARYTP